MSPEKPEWEYRVVDVGKDSDQNVTRSSAEWEPMAVTSTTDLMAGATQRTHMWVLFRRLQGVRPQLGATPAPTCQRCGSLGEETSVPGYFTCPTCKTTI